MLMQRDEDEDKNEDKYEDKNEGDRQIGSSIVHDNTSYRDISAM